MWGILVCFSIERERERREKKGISGGNGINHPRANKALIGKIHHNSYNKTLTSGANKAQTKLIIHN